jgi:type I restriction enzyme S subunit
MSFILRPLNNLCERNIASINPKAKPDKEFWYVDISAVDNTTKKITSPWRINGKSASVRARQIVHQNDVIVSTTRPNLNAVAIVPSELHGEVCSTGFCVLRCGPELDPDYLFSFVQSKMFVDLLVDLVQGALYPAVTDKQIFIQSIPWVPLNQQRQIAAKLKAQLAEVETARKAAEMQLAEIKRLPTRLLAQAFKI